MRKAIEEDMEKLVERGDGKVIGLQTFYAVMYDPPFQELLCYSLKKEWDEGMLDATCV